MFLYWLAAFIGSIVMLVACIHSDLERRREIKAIREQRNTAEYALDKEKTVCNSCNEHMLKLEKQIGCPPGVVFLPEKSYWEDLHASRALCEKYAKLHQEKHQMLVSIWNYIHSAAEEDTDVKLGAVPKSEPFDVERH